MRLIKSEITGLTQAIADNLGDISAELRLFGSRVDDSLKGGDIDLLLIVSNDNDRDQVVYNKHYILADMKTNIGDQKIDLKITTEHELKTDPFLKSIYPSSLQLKVF